MHGLETRRKQNSILLIIYVGVGLCKNMGPISSRVYCIYFDQPTWQCLVWPIVPIMHEQPSPTFSFWLFTQKYNRHVMR
jgi:hypothetical protein